MVAKRRHTTLAPNKEQLPRAPWSASSASSMIEEERSNAALSLNDANAERVAQLWRQILSMAMMVLFLLVVFLLSVITLVGVLRGNDKFKNEPITLTKQPELSLAPSTTPPPETVAVFTLPPLPPPTPTPVSTTIAPLSSLALVGSWNLTYVVPYSSGSCFYNWTIQLILSLNVDQTFIVSFGSTDLACYSGTTVRWACDTSFSQCPSYNIPNVLTTMKLYGLWAGNVESLDGNISGKLILQPGMTYNCTENRQNWPPNARGTIFYGCRNPGSFFGSFEYMIARGNDLNFLFLKPGWATIITNSGTQTVTSVLYQQQ